MKFFRCTLLSMLLALPLAAIAQPYPNKPIRLIVADSPGGAPDTIARLLGQKLSENLGQAVVIDNRPGAAGIIAADVASHAPADGYTIFMNVTALWAVLPHVKKKLPYDPFKSFASISLLATSSNVLVVNPSLPAKSVAELVQLAKSNPGNINYASAGAGTPAHLAGEMLNLLADIKMTHIPFKGAGPGLVDVMAGNVQLMITSPMAARTHLNSGRVRALATSGKQRNPGLPDLPTIAETVPGYDISQSWGISAPKGTPAEIIKVLNAAIVNALKLPDVRENLLSTGAVPAGGTPEELDAFIAEENKRLGELISKTGIVLQD
jgi:tripartite-type tricarboxylate transporter receptor subunit TctC